jgi:hypothetical protein
MRRDLRPALLTLRGGVDGDAWDYLTAALACSSRSA